MIVKNEAHVIQRCLDSVKEAIDYWVIVDTGSTDGTQEIIQAEMKSIPGELYERPWVNWGVTRSEAFDLAKGKGDYILFMDADDILEFSNQRKRLPYLQHDLYNMWRGTDSFSYLKPQVVKGNLPWKWVGVTHEYLDCDANYSSAVLDAVHYTSMDDGARSYNPKKYWENVHLLEAGLEEEPDNLRYMFYLAESYRDAGEKGKALEWFQKRVDRGGWNEEVFWCKVQIGRLLKELGLPQRIVIEAFKDALNDRPHRVEPYYYLAEIYNDLGEYQQAYQYLKAYEIFPKPKEKDFLFNIDWMSKYGMLFQLSICSYYIKEYQESLNTCQRLLSMKELPESWRNQVELNRVFPLEKLQQKP